MAEVSIRDLRNRGGEIIDQASQGETVTVTRAGKPVAELRPLSKRPLNKWELLERMRHLPDVDPVAMRADIDAVIDPSL